MKPQGVTAPPVNRFTLAAARLDLRRAKGPMTASNDHKAGPWAYLDGTNAARSVQGAPVGEKIFVKRLTIE